MNIEVVMPKMGESIQEGKILRWVKNVGDVVERDEVLLEISTDKVDTEVPSPSAGRILEIRAKENDTVEVGSVIAILSTDVNASASSTPVENSEQRKAAKKSEEVVTKSEPERETAAPEVSSAEPVAMAADSGSSGGDVEVVMPKMGESIQEGKVLSWVKKVGDHVERDEVLLEISTDKVDTEVPSPVAGVLREILAIEGDVVEVGAVIARINSESSSAPKKSQDAVASAPVSTPIQNGKSGAEKSLSESKSVDISTAKPTAIPRKSGNRFYSPLVRSIASVEGIAVDELDSISGTGMQGRVTKADILEYVGRRSKEKSTSAAPSSKAARSDEGPKEVKSALEPVGLPVGSDDEVIPMDRVRQIIAEHMVRSKLTSPHVTSVAEADVTGIVKLRESAKASFEKREGFKLTYTPFFGIACVEGVKQWPMVNVSVDGKNIILHKRINLGMATALPNGNLIVPVAKNADTMNITGLARTLNDLAVKARGKKLSPDDISGGTITITNVGSFGSLFGSPVINQPQTAIMGIGAIQKRPVVREYNGEDVIVVRHMVYVSLTYDHRVIDGALATQCLAAICRSLEGMNQDTLIL